MYVDIEKVDETIWSEKVNQKAIILCMING